jgi:hypothetical protein
MAQSYMLVIYQNGHVYSQERRKFADHLHRNEAGRLGIFQYPDGSVGEADALRLVNLWNQNAIGQAAAQGLPVRFAYYL